MKIPINNFRWRDSYLPEFLWLRHICRGRLTNYKPADGLISLMPSEFHVASPVPSLQNSVFFEQRRILSILSHHEFIRAQPAFLAGDVLGTPDTFPTFLGILLCGVLDAADLLWA